MIFIRSMPCRGLENISKRQCAARFPWPHVIRLLSYVRVPRIVQRKISRRALFARDGWRCVYCGTSNGRLTLDHVIPRSRGGDSVWENVVTSCSPCNLRKGNRLPHEVQMELAHPPRPPAPVLFIRLATPKIPQRLLSYFELVCHRIKGLAQAPQLPACHHVGYLDVKASLSQIS